MNDHEERVVAEKEQLDEKLDKLSAFMHSNVFGQLHTTDQELLGMQQHLMLGYSKVLAARINRF